MLRKLFNANFIQFCEDDTKEKEGSVGKGSNGKGKKDIRNHKNRVSNKEKETSISCTNSMRSRASNNVSLATTLLENTKKPMFYQNREAGKLKNRDPYWLRKNDKLILKHEIRSLTKDCSHLQK